MIVLNSEVVGENEVETRPFASWYGTMAECRGRRDAKGRVATLRQPIVHTALRDEYKSGSRECKCGRAARQQIDYPPAFLAL